jgi:LEA14-like dessication related protein
MIDRRRALLWVPVVLVAGCATVGGDPVQVQVVGVEPLEGEGLELRFLCKLRVQNPNDTPIDYNGVYLDLQVRGSSLATGVSDATGTVPRYGEVVLAVPVTASAFRLVRQAIDLYASTDRSRIDYVLKGKIGGPMFSPVRFESHGELTLPAGIAGGSEAPAAAPPQ